MTKAGKGGKAVIGKRKKKEKIHEREVLRYHYVIGEETRARTENGDIKVRGLED